MSDDTEAQFRIAFRHEGEFVRCYYAGMENMDGAVLLGTMRTSILRAQPDVWVGWKLMMSKAVGEAAKKVTGVNIIGYKERKAPENERSGNA